jgi:hypothetical protein
MKQILPFNPEGHQSEIDLIMKASPVKNLTPEEVLTTMRLIELQAFLAEGRYNQIVVHKNDKRLELCDDNDRFLAMLADCDARDVLLFSGRCRALFGRKNPITAVSSAVSECGSGYYGRGWEIAPHIQRLRKFMIEIDIRQEVRKLLNI